jgi:integrase
MGKVELKYLMRDVTRHGKRRVHVRIKGKTIQLRAPEGSPEFMIEYAEAVKTLQSGTDKPKKKVGVIVGSFEWVGNQYMKSPEFRGLDAISQRTRKSVLQGCFDEKSPSGARCGDYPARDLTAKHVRFLRDKRAEQPGAANNRLKYLSVMFAWAVEADHMAANVTRDVKPLKYRKEGFHTWTQDEVAAFEAHWPIGSKPRLALALMLFTGARIGDAVNLGPDNIRKGTLTFMPGKTKGSSGAVVEIPVLPDLARAIEAATTGAKTFLANGKGDAHTVKSLGNMFKDWATAAGIPHCTPHGLRKAGATTAAERGATDRELMAIFGWSTANQASTYTRKADKKRLASRAVELLSREGKENETATPEKDTSATPATRH